MTTDPTELSTLQMLFIELDCVVPPGCKTKRMLDLERLLRQSLETCEGILQNQDDPDLQMGLARNYVEQIRESGIDMDELRKRE